LAKCPNVRIKLGGMGMHMFGFEFEKQPVPPSSEELANAWKPFVETCIEAFGPKRAMFESNFPVDKRYYSYGVMWNAYKRLAAQYSADDKRGLFVDAARETYRLPVSV
jgi:predicted TIM-barrel fold metal-dependent hydrolase